MSSQPRVLLAVGNEIISKILRKHLNTSEAFRLLDQEIMHFQFLNEIIEINDPDILVVHDVFLPSDKETKKEREDEWLTFFHMIRQKNDTLRIVFLCERVKDDNFLNQIIGLGIQDIFNESSIDMKTFIEQLSQPARYANVSKFRKSFNVAAPVQEKVEEEQEEIDDEVDEETDSDSNHEDKGAGKEETKERRTLKPKRKSKVESPPKEVVVEKTIEKLVHFQVQKKIILISSPFSRSGCTFLSHLLAKEIASFDVPVTYIENPFRRSYTYDRFEGHRRAENYRSVFYSYLDLEFKNAYASDWELDGVNMIVKHPEEDMYTEEQLTFELFIKVLMNIKSTITIIDVGNDWDKKVFRDLLDIADNLFMVIEPDISDIQYLGDPKNNATAAYRTLIEDSKTSLVGNRISEPLKKNKLFKELFKEEMTYFVPNYDSDVVFECQDKAIFINEHSSAQEMTSDALFDLIEDILPKEQFKRKRKWFKLFK